MKLLASQFCCCTIVNFASKALNRNLESITYLALSADNDRLPTCTCTSRSGEKNFESVILGHYM